ncbi:MAG: RNA methyltransferase, partial [Treponemataceae bacterium]|nr:RNA methyltransferase [Treponemataceae bacterium]
GIRARITGTTADEGGKAALIFGNERTGLTDDELTACTAGVVIPASPDFASLNLSHAVQIMSYQLFRTQDTTSPGYTPITLERLDCTVTTIADDLQKIGFFTLAGRPDMERFWRMILSRAALSEGEAAYLEKLFDKAAGLATRGQAI